MGIDRDLTGFDRVLMGYWQGFDGQEAAVWRCQGLLICLENKNIKVRALQKIARWRHSAWVSARALCVLHKVGHCFGNDQRKACLCAWQGL